MLLNCTPGIAELQIRGLLTAWAGRSLASPWHPAPGENTQPAPPGLPYLPRKPGQQIHQGAQAGKSHPVSFSAL